MCRSVAGSLACDDFAKRSGIEAYVECAPSIPYREALREMMRADGLLAMQAANCNEQIPAKVYEYIRAGRPLIGLTDPDGDTADLLMRAGVRHIAPLDDVAAIGATLTSFLADLAAGTPIAPPDEAVAQHSRLSRTRELVAVLDAAVAG